MSLNFQDRLAQLPSPVLNTVYDMVTLSFDEWLAEFNKIAAAEGCEDYVGQTGKDCWTTAYEDGVTPSEAWDTEKSYAADAV